MTPASAKHAARQAKALLVRTLPGSRKGTVKAHLIRAERIATAIWKRFNAGPHQAQVKHFRWYLETQTHTLSHSTRYRHWLTVRALISALNKYENWLPFLKGPWIRPDGETSPLKPGRPPKLSDCAFG